ncbi:IQ domain-containing protein IQM2-like isoform X2 [Primulina huaijiensis]|uniref:IQ domain-containing protein IQM2-like isoform X2 n=1 Tax=Primulina huaijiensis TaxID=1492673 RepID=UPI003CC75243
MGVSCSCPFAVFRDLENDFESIVAKSNNLGDEYQKILLRSISFRNKDSGKVLGSVEFVGVETVSTRQEIDVSSPRSVSSMKTILNSPVLGRTSSPKDEAAIKLQKVYKSFRTRRKLADCAVLVEQSWWKLLDFAELKHSSISFFDIDKHETAISRWSRARTRAAKVGKGLSKNGKAQKLALQHWLEAIDPRHRYGHNLHFYYAKWLNSQSKEPFFYWLDVGEGKDANLIEKCPRLKLQQQCIKYLGPMERKAYEMAIKDGKLLYKQTGEFLDTINEPKGSKWIFVLSTSRILYVGKKWKGSFQHSSFLAGGATLAAGRIVSEKGVLKAVWPHSGHYRPTPENFQDLISFLRENDVDLTYVKLDCIDGEEDDYNGKKGSLYLRSNTSEEDLTEKDPFEAEEIDVKESNKPRIPNDFLRKLPTLHIPSKAGLLATLKSGNESAESNHLDGYETERQSFSSERSSLTEESDEAKEDTISEESIFKRINTHKAMVSYQLGKQLSCKWSTGAGPRIGCLRDYPSGLQSQALEQVHLSPRSKNRLRFGVPSRVITPDSSNLAPSCRRMQSFV